MPYMGVWTGYVNRKTASGNGNVAVYATAPATASAQQQMPADHLWGCGRRWKECGQ